MDSCETSGKRPHGWREYIVIIEEHIGQEFSVAGCDIYHALENAEVAYKQGQLVVQPSAPTARLIMARDDETGNMTEWKEF